MGIWKSIVQIKRIETFITSNYFEQKQSTPGSAGKGLLEFGINATSL